MDAYTFWSTFSGRRSPNGDSSASVIEALGGHLNAYTSPDEMVVHVSLPAQHWEKGLEILTLLLFPDHFPALLLEKEKQVVLEEIKREQDAPDRLLFRDLLGHAFDHHAYARPVLGEVDTVAETTPQDLERLHQRLFQPHRMTFAIVGDIAAPSVLAALQESIPDTTLAMEVETPQAAQHQGQSITIKEKELFEHRLAIAWPVPNITAEEAPGLEILCMLWGQGASSPLEKRVRWERQMVNEIGVSLFQPAYAGLAVLSVFGIHGSLHSLLVQIYETLHKLIKKGPTTQELEKARAWVEAAQAYKGETVQGRAQRYGESYLRYGDVNHSDLFFERLLTVTQEDIHKLALRFLSQSNATLVAHVPQGQGGDFQQLSRLWENIWKPPIVATLPPTHRQQSFTAPTVITGKTQINSPPFTKKLWGSLPVIYQPTYKIPAMHFYSAWPHGQTYEPQSQQGVGTLTAEMLLLETQ